MTIKIKRTYLSIIAAFLFLNICTLGFADYSRDRIINQALDEAEQKLKENNSFLNSSLNRSSRGSPAPSYSSSFTDGNTTFPNETAHSGKKAYSPSSRYIQGDQPEGPQSLSSFLNNFDYGVTFATDQKPSIYFEGVIPIYQTEDKRKTLFTHDRIYEQGGGGAFSGGLGYRDVIANDKLMIGANTFYDYQRDNRQCRLGMGIEAFTKDGLELRSNYYIPITQKKLVSETSAYRYYERPAEGFDVEAGTTLPYLPWVKTFMGFSKYYFTQEADETKIQGRLEIKPLDGLTFNIYGNREPNSNKNQFGADLRFSLNFDTFRPKDLWKSLKQTCRLDNSEDIYDKDLIDRALDRVERNFTIVMDRTKENKNDPLPVGSIGSIQIQLIWDRNNDDDLDLHLLLPPGVGDNDHIYYGDPESYIGEDLFASLDVDDIPLEEPANAHPGRDHVENIYVSPDTIVAGTYTPYVHVYDFTSSVTATVNVFKNGTLYHSYTTTFTAEDQVFNIPAIVYP